MNFAFVNRIEIVDETGLTDEMRADIAGLEKRIKNKQIMTAKCNGVTESKGKPGMFSLYLGRFKEWRSDKSVADSLKKIQAQEAAFTDSLKLIGK